MKNLIYILVDALSFDNIGKREYRTSPTPFLDSLKEKSYSSDFMYTQAPYTEAAFVSTLCGENVLDHGGYLLGLNNCETSYASILKRKGYHTLSTFSPYIMSKSYIKDVDDFYYSRTFSMEPLKLYRLTYYKEKYERNEIIEEEYKICELLIEEAFEILLDQIIAIINEEERVKLISTCIESKERLPELLKSIEEQQARFLRNKKEYVEKIFEEWDEHVLLKDTNLSLGKKVSQETRIYLEKKWADFLNDIQQQSNYYMRVNLKYDWKYLIDLAINDENKYHGAIQTYRRYKERYNNEEIKKSINESVEEKVTVSAKRQLDLFAEKIIELDKVGENYFTFIHLEDFHLPSMIYTYDTDDLSLIDKEFENLREFVKQLPDNYRGNLLADMSAFYVDCAIKEFYNTIMQNTKDDFVFVITADHGYPCNYNPPRPIIFNAFYQENYHIPIIIYDSVCEKKELGRELQSSLDIMPMLLNAVGCEEAFPKGREYILIEYPGPGCPDISSKEIYYAIFDGKYKIAFKVKLLDDVTEARAVLATDIENDPEETKNLIKKINKSSRMKGLVKIVNQRHKEIRDRFQGEKFYNRILKG